MVSLKVWAFRFLLVFYESLSNVPVFHQNIPIDSTDTDTDHIYTH